MLMFTYADACEAALDYLGGTSDALALRDAKRSVMEAYREVTNARTWSYLATAARIVTHGPYETGTIAYDHLFRQVLLSDGTWPAWAGPGAHLRIGVVTSEVKEQLSPTLLTLTDVNPGVDIDLDRLHFTGLTLTAPVVITSAGHGLSALDATGAPVVNRVVIEGVTSADPVPVVTTNGTWVVTVIDADTFSLDGSDGTGDTAWDVLTGTWRRVPTTPFTIYLDSYLLPDDFSASDTMIYEGNFGGLQYTDATDILWWERFTRSCGTPRYYCLKGHPLWPGRMSVQFAPYPDIEGRTIDYIYARRPRPLRTAEYTEGTLTVAAGSVMVTGNGTVWDETMVGGVLRVGTSAKPPTSWVGSVPPVWETVVVEYLSPTSLRVANAAPMAYAQLKYLLSDPIDIEQGAMLTAFLRGVEKQLSIARTMDKKPDAFAAYDLALKAAQAADSRSFQGRTMGGRPSRYVPAKYQPARFW